MKNNMLKIIFTAMALLTFVSCASTNYFHEDFSWVDFGSISYGDDPRQYIEITAPKYINKNVSIILFMCGYGNKMVDLTFLEKYRDEFIIAKLDYCHRSPDRLDLGMNELLSDIHNGLKTLKNTVEKRGIQVNKVILIGTSFGGTLALMYSYTFYDLSPVPIAFCVSMAGLTDVTDPMNLQLIGWPNNPIVKAWLNISKTLPKTGVSSNDITKLGYSQDILDMLKRNSPIYYVNEYVPPTIIIHDTNDKIVPFSNSMSLSHVLRAHGVPSIFIQSTANTGHLLGSNVTNRNLVFAPANGRLPDNNTKRVTRRIHPVLEEELLNAIDDFILRFCQ